MADVHKGHNSPGIKLFGKTIMVQVIKEIKDEPNKVDDDQTLEKRPDKIIPCPRCKSMETKFCYFNNYNVNQPRHFCKGCQRYWTAGGALRNVPVGAGRRKAKPPGRELLPGTFSDGFFDTSGIHQLDLDGVVEEWQAAAVAAAAAHSDYRHVFPAKRRRSTSSGGSG